MEHCDIDRPLTNQDFLTAVRDSFKRFLDSGTSRSTAKLKPLHGAISKDMNCRLAGRYVVKSQGWGDDRESIIKGRYIDKRVDIAIMRDEHAVAGIAVKFVMQNYSQNSNNYFEGMLGETANIRCNGIPYFQIFVILDKLPHYKRDKSISHWESVTNHNLEKYIALSSDDTQRYMHTPNKTLIYVIHIPEPATPVATLEEYRDYYKSIDLDIALGDIDASKFGQSVIVNDYALFADKVYHTIESL